MLVTAQQGLNEPRYPSLPGIMKAKKKPLEELELDDLDLDEEDAEPKLKTIERFLPPKKEAGKLSKVSLLNRQKSLFHCSAAKLKSFKTWTFKETGGC